MVALKMILASESATPIVLQRFQIEAEAAATLRPRVAVYEICATSAPGPLCEALLRCTWVRRPWLVRSAPPRFRSEGKRQSMDTKHLDRVVKRIREAWPNVQIVVRGDSGFCREPLLAWCEANRVDYVFGLARNDRLEKANLGDGRGQLLEGFLVIGLARLARVRRDGPDRDFLEVGARDLAQPRVGRFVGGDWRVARLARADEVH